MPQQYAVVAYVRNDLGRWVEDLRADLHPEHAHLPAHITVLPPRPLNGSEAQALATLRLLCREVQPFEITLGDVETFIPTTPTIFLRVAHAAYKLRELHDRLAIDTLSGEEPWPYMPHLTIVKMNDLPRAQAVLNTIQKRWSAYRGSRRVVVEQLTFVREGQSLCWDDVAPIQLGRELAPAGR